MTGTANRLVDQSAHLGGSVTRRLPNDVQLNIPAGGVESQLLNAINGARANSWIDFNNLNFDTGSSFLGPGSTHELDNIAAILKAYPDVDLRIAGYTDTVGSLGNNLKLSWSRAEAVKTELVNRGVNGDRLTTEGFGEVTSDNDTAVGRANNRRVSLQVTQQ